MIDRNPDRPMSSPSQPSKPGDAWQPCPQGLFVDAARNEQTRVSRRRMLRTAGTAAVVLVGAGVSGVVWRRSTATSPAGEVAKGEPSIDTPITCDECLRLLPDLLHNHVVASTRIRMERHFANCPHCMTEWTKLREGRA